MAAFLGPPMAAAMQMVRLCGSQVADTAGTLASVVALASKAVFGPPARACWAAIVFVGQVLLPVLKVSTSMLMCQQSCGHLWDGSVTGCVEISMLSAQDRRQGAL